MNEVRGNLCRIRAQPRVRSGMITETGPVPPVTLGFSEYENDSDNWEEIVDSDGHPTGIERRSFRLNILNGSKESIDDKWCDARRQLGIPESTNNRREASNNGLEGGSEQSDSL